MRLYFSLWFITYGLRPLTSWRFAHTRPRGNQRLFPLFSFLRIGPAAPQHFRYLQNNSCEKVAMGIDPALGFIWNRPRTYSKMLTLPMVHPVPRKLAGHPWPVHAIFFNCLKFKAEFRLFQSRNLNHLWTETS